MWNISPNSVPANTSFCFSFLRLGPSLFSVLFPLISFADLYCLSSSFFFPWKDTIGSLALFMQGVFTSSWAVFWLSSVLPVKLHLLSKNIFPWTSLIIEIFPLTIYLFFPSYFFLHLVICWYQANWPIKPLDNPKFTLQRVAWYSQSSDIHMINWRMRRQRVSELSFLET